MDIFLLFLCFVVLPFDSTWFIISKLRYKFYKNKLFSKNNNVCFLCGVEWYLGWLGWSVGTWPLVWENVLHASWLCNPPQWHSVYSVLANHYMDVWIQKKSSWKVKMDSYKSITIVKTNKTQYQWWMSHQNI